MQQMVIALVLLSGKHDGVQFVLLYKNLSLNFPGPQKVTLTGVNCKVVEEKKTS